jgi:hypothetical protein
MLMNVVYFVLGVAIIIGAIFAVCFVIAVVGAVFVDWVKSPERPQPRPQPRAPLPPCPPQRYGGCGRKGSGAERMAGFDIGSG